MKGYTTGLKGCMHVVTASAWAIVASAYAITTAMHAIACIVWDAKAYVWASTDSRCAVTARMWSFRYLCVCAV